MKTNVDRVVWCNPGRWSKRAIELAKGIPEIFEPDVEPDDIVAVLEAIERSLRISAAKEGDFRWGARSTRRRARQRPLPSNVIELAHWRGRPLTDDADEDEGA